MAKSKKRRNRLYIFFRDNVNDQAPEWYKEGHG